MKVIELQQLFDAICWATTKGVIVPAPSFEFGYMLSKNKRLLKAEIDLIVDNLDAGFDMDKMRQYSAEKARLETAGELEKTIKRKLETRFPGIADQLDQRKEREQEVLQKDVEIKLHLFPENQWPKQLPAELADGLFPLVAQSDDLPPPKKGAK